MDKSVLDFVVEKTRELMNAPSCCTEAKVAAQDFLDAVGTDREAEATKNYLAELEEDVTPIDGLIAFTGSEQGAQVFGAQRAAQMLEHAKKVKAAGGKYCDCPACAPGAEILAKKQELI